MKPTLAILLLVTTCFALEQPRLDQFGKSTTNGVVFISATKAFYELKPELVPLPTGAIQRVVTMRRMLASTTTYTNRPFVLSLRCAPPFNVEVSTNFVSWETYDQSTNSVYNIDICAEQQIAYPVAFFRCRPLPPSGQLSHIMRGL